MSDDLYGHRPGIAAPAESCAVDGAKQKLQANLFATLALAGHTAYELADGSYVVTRWGYTRRCEDLHALAVLARQIGGAA